MNLKHLSDKELLASTDQAVEKERQSTTTVLYHFLEVDRRRLYSALGFKSLFDYAVKHKNYSESAAYRRIAAMRMLKDIPEIEEKLSSGSLSLTNIGMVRRLLNQESKIQNKEFSKFEKADVLSQIENCTTREAERVIAKMSSCPEKLVADKIRAISDGFSEIKFSADQELLNKIEKLKGLLAHKLPQATLLDLFHELCDLGLQKHSPPAPVKSCVKRVSLKRQVWQRDKGKCKNCGSTYALEKDHIIPKAKGGSNKLENMRLLCRSCNQRAAIEQFGLTKMDRYIN